MTELSNKVIWITGASSGIGEALARELSSLENVKLILSARRQNELERVKKECGRDDITILPLDLRDTESLEEKCTEALTRFGHIDILINNSGISQRSYVRETKMEVYRKIMEINFFGNITLTKGLLPYMTQTGGHIVVISSVVGKFGSIRRSGYSASKHALHGFYDSLRAEEWHNNIKVTIVCPGYVNTSISKSALRGTGEKHNETDETTAKGMDAQEAARKIIKAIGNDREEIVMGGRERYGVLLKRFFPRSFSRYMRKTKFT